MKINFSNTKDETLGGNFYILPGLYLGWLFRENYTWVGIGLCWFIWRVELYHLKGKPSL